MRMLAPRMRSGRERRAVGNGFIGDGRTQVGKAAKLLTQSKQACFGTALIGQPIKLRTAYGAEQHGSGSQATLHGLRRTGRAELDRCSAADGQLFKTKIVTAEVSDRTKNAHRFARDLPVQLHLRGEPLCSTSLLLPPPSWIRRLAEWTAGWVIDHRDQVLIVNLFFTIGQVGEFGVEYLDFIARPPSVPAR